MIEKLASLWRSDFHAKTILGLRLGDVWGQWKNGFWWTPKFYGDASVSTWDCNTGLELALDCQKVPIRRCPEDYTLHAITVDPLQDLVVSLFIRKPPEIDTLPLDDTFLVDFGSVSSKLPHPHAVCTSLVCKRVFARADDCLRHILAPVICGDRVVFLYDCDHYGMPRNIFIQVIDWRKGHSNSVSPYYS